MAGNVIIETANVPPGFCGQGWATDWPILAGLLSARLAGTLNTFNYGNSTPSPENQGSPWYRTNADGSPDKVYTFWNGVWVAPHAVAPGIVTMYEGTEASIVTLDGGESAAIGPASGPMWEKVSAMDARFPMGPGTMPISAAVVAVGATGGLEKVAITAQEMPAHTHQAMATPDNSGGTGGDRLRAVASIANSTHVTASAGGDAAGDTVAHENKPPYYAIYFIRRTARLMYRI